MARDLTLPQEIMNFSNIKISYRLLIIVIVGALGLTIFASVSLSSLHDALVAERAAKTREHTEVAQAMVQGIARDWAKAGRSRAEAQQTAMSALRSMRYAGDQYFWVTDMSGVMLMHPAEPALVGTSVMQLNSATGAKIFGDMIDVVRKNGGGFYQYMWRTQNDPAPRTKITYVAGIPEWNWVVGTGVYIDDINAIFWKLTLRLCAMGAGLLVLSLLVALLVTRSVVRPLSRVKDNMGELAQGRLDLEIPGAERQDEIGSMVRALGAIQSNLGETAAIADRIAQGDLTVAVKPLSEWDRLGNALKSMLEQLRHLVSDTTQASGAVHVGASSIAESVEQMSAAATQLSSSVSEIAATMEELSASSSQITEHSSAVVDIANMTWESSQKGALAMEHLSAKMESIHEENQNSLSEIIELGRTSKEIGRVMTIINTIADQTKLIAFNAALEAASAGDAGRRFGVVAAEIRRLADSVTESTGEIESRVSQIQDSINRLVINSEKGAVSIVEGKASAVNAADRLGEMVEAARKTSVSAQQISLSTQQQKTAAGQVVIALKEIADSTVQTAASMNELTDVSRNLQGLSSELESQVGRFQLGSES
jgi:methyl-accepting chemotaxis protein